MPINGIDIKNGDVHVEDTNGIENAQEVARDKITGRNQCCIYQAFNNRIYIKNIAKASTIYLNQSSTLFVADEALFKSESKLLEIVSWEIEGNPIKEINCDSYDNAYETSKEYVNNIHLITCWDGKILKLFDISNGQYVVNVAIDNIMFLFKQEQNEQIDDDN